MSIRIFCVWGYALAIVIALAIDIFGWSGYIDDRKIWDVLDEVGGDLAPPLWSYITLMVLFYGANVFYGCDITRDTYDRREDSPLDKTRMKPPFIMLFYGGSVVAIGYRSFVVASVLSGLAFVISVAMYFHFMFKLKDRHKNVTYGWTAMTSFTLLWTYYMFMLSVTGSVSIETSRTMAWYYSWLSFLGVVSIVFFGILYPTIAGSVFAVVLFVGIGARIYDRELMQACFAFILAGAQILFWFIFVMVFMCCEY